MKDQVTRTELNEIGRGVARLLTNETTVGWKASLLPWARSAFKTIAPRLVLLWKKNKRRARTSDDDDSPIDEPGSDITTIAPVIATSRRPKRPHLEQATPNIAQARLFVHQNIYVQIEGVPDEEEGVPLFALVGVSSLIAEDACMLDDIDIRSEHLRLDKFYSIMESLYKGWDISEVSYTLPDSGTNGEKMAIRHQDEFVAAIGILEWYAQRSGGQVVVQVQLQKRYRF